MNTPKQIKKLYVKEMVEFVNGHVPDTDEATLFAFLRLVNSQGTYGDISDEQLLQMMEKNIRYIPTTCQSSLMILADLLDILPKQPSLQRSLPISLSENIPQQPLNKRPSWAV